MDRIYNTVLLATLTLVGDLTTALIVLKLLYVIDWSWLCVLSPALLACIAFLVLPCIKRTFSKSYGLHGGAEE